MSKFWFIGDCYTQGLGCLSGDPYFKFKTKEDNIWVHHVVSYFNSSFELDTVPHNCSNELIMDKFLKNLHKFKVGDIVVVGLTYPSGIITCAGEKPYSLNYVNREDWNKYIKINSGLVKSYMEHIYEPNLQFWNNLYTSQIKSVAVLLKDRGVRVLVWDYREWKEGNYETIEQSTAGDIADSHFSYKGHLDFANNVISRINAEKFIV